MQGWSSRDVLLELSQLFEWASKQKWAGAVSHVRDHNTSMLDKVGGMLLAFMLWCKFVY